MKWFFFEVKAPWTVPTFESPNQTMIDENQVNNALGPANDAFSAIRDFGDWIFDFFTNLFSGAFGHLT